MHLLSHSYVRGDVGMREVPCLLLTRGAMLFKSVVV